MLCSFAFNNGQSYTVCVCVCVCAHMHVRVCMEDNSKSCGSILITFSGSIGCMPSTIGISCEHPCLQTGLKWWG